MIDVLDNRNGPVDHSCRGTWHLLGKNREGHPLYECDASGRPHRLIAPHSCGPHVCRMEEKCSEAITREEWLAREDRKVCQQIADAYKAVAYAEDHKISDGRGDIYRQMKRAMLTAIRQVYGLSPLLANRVYDVMIDSGEDVAYCVRYVKANPGRQGSSAYEH
jgi:hypothetical protein